MRVALISDLHLQGADDPNQAAFVAWLDRLDVDLLVLLGDIFQAWWGFQGTVPVDFMDTCAALKRVVHRDIDLVVVPGNHDFALGPFFHDTLHAEVCGSHLRELDGRRVWLAHGDEADTSINYQLVSKILRGRPFSAAMRLLGPGMGMRFLRRLAGSSRDHMGEVGPLLDGQRRWAQQRLGEGADLVVLGHLHHPGMDAFDRGTLVRLGGWSQDRTWCLLEDGVPQLVVG
jgi:UDP-2,3-diacylglucosamine hydrolase